MLLRKDKVSPKVANTNAEELADDWRLYCLVAPISIWHDGVLPIPHHCWLLCLARHAGMMV